jgi:acetolactate synthase-1/2/3 large subunit
MTDQTSRVRVADFIVRLLTEHHINDAFIVTGGGAMHLNDAFGRNQAMHITYCHHEQACAMAAEAYSRVSGRTAVLNVTTGPGGINALNGVYGAYTDSIGMVVISGQVKRETFLGSYPGLPLRQLGDQEVLIVPMVKPITKYAAVVNDPAQVRYMLEKALWLAHSGRPGPVWLDVPIDVQGALIVPEQLPGFDPAAPGALDDVHPNTLTECGALSGDALAKKVDSVLELLHSARRPVVLAGGGVRISGAHELFCTVVEKLGIPVLSAWNAHDVLPTDHPLHCGRPGSVGNRAGNFVVQAADVVLVLGSRLNIRQISYNFKAFAKDAKVVMVDVDAAELNKPTLNIALPVHADLQAFLALMNERLSAGFELGRSPAPFVAAAKRLTARYNAVTPEYRDQTDVINPYVFIEKLFEALADDDITVAANGSACVMSFQAAHLRGAQRLFTNSGSASMGYDLPAAIGAAVASPGRRVICLAGDGSIMMNLQELQTIVGERLPVKTFVINNNGYLSIRQSQANNFPDNITGCDPASGVSLPDFTRLGAAFGLPVFKATTPTELRETIAKALATPGPCLCEVVVDEHQQFAPKLTSKRMPDGSMVSPPLEDMAPFLPRDEFEAVQAELRSL